MMFAVAASTALTISVAALVAYLWRFRTHLVALVTSTIWLIASAATTAAWFIAAAQGFTEYGRITQQWIQPAGRFAAAVTVILMVYSRVRQHRAAARELRDLRDEWAER
jgi:hypothetical protein